MQFTIDDSGSAATMTLTGRLDIAGAETVALPLATLSGSKTEIFVDMAGVSYVASIGLRHLLTAAKTVARRGGRLVLLNPNESVTQLIEMTGLTDLLKIESGTGS